MKKIISAFLAAAACISVLSVSVYAAKDEAKDPTFCFDTESSVSQWTTYGSVEDVNLRLSISNDQKESGAGALQIWEGISSDIPSDKQYGGFYVTASSLGLENFSGCTMTASVFFAPDASKVTNKFSAFSDGIVWINSDVSTASAGSWSKISLSVPENAKNTKFGFSIPTFSLYEGAVAYVDNVVISDKDGNVIANVGDYKAADISEMTDSLGTGGRIILIVVLVVIVALIALGVAYLVKTMKTKFR